MVIAFKKRSENPKDIVSEGLHVYVVSNLRRDKNTRSNKGIAGALSITYASLMSCNYKTALSSHRPTPKISNSHSSNIKATDVVALLLSTQKLQIVQEMAYFLVSVFACSDNWISSNKSYQDSRKYCSTAFSTVLPEAVKVTRNARSLSRQTGRCPESLSTNCEAALPHVGCQFADTCCIR